MEHLLPATGSETARRRGPTLAVGAIVASLLYAVLLIRLAGWCLAPEFPPGSRRGALLLSLPPAMLYAVIVAQWALDRRSRTGLALVTAGALIGSTWCILSGWALGAFIV